MGSRRSRPAHTRGCGRYAALLRPQGPSGTRASRPPTLLLVACRRKRCYGIRSATVTGKDKKNYSGAMTSFPNDLSYLETSPEYLEEIATVATARDGMDRAARRNRRKNYA